MSPVRACRCFILAAVLLFGLARVSVAQSVATVAALAELGTIGVQALADALPSMLVLDVRSSEEFDVGHVPGAIHIDPDLPHEEFRTRFAEYLHGGDLVFYCTIGNRSQAYADHLAFELEASVEARLLVLDGGLIAWANAGLPMAGRDGATDLVHVAEPGLARHLKDPTRARY